MLKDEQKQYSLGTNPYLPFGLGGGGREGSGISSIEDLCHYIIQF